MKTDELREKYLSFFETKGCVRRPSDVLVPRWDPSVLFTPAGMNQFKDHFLGRCKLEFRRATTCQKCLRTGDIDNVGRTAYHHTFFEMLGNFSFGDYFKREAINWGWEFLTGKQWLAIPADRLTVSVYVDDDEAAEIWIKDIKLTSDRIQRLGEDDNFWPAGAPTQGPDGVCGPCSEIFYHTDQGSVEIWNLVFTQFNRVGSPPNNLRPLPSKNIDTGMGLERAASVLQGVTTNYHIDILRPIVEAAAEITGQKYDPQSEAGRRLRRITDHVRACTFAIHENVYPGPNKEKYVIRRLLRRAVLDGRQLGLHDPFLHRLVPVVAEMMKASYPELRETTERVAQVIKSEEANFFGTIDSGLDRIGRLFDDMRRDGRGVVSGAEAADMYTTYGFPPELLESMAAEHNLMFDWEGYRREMERHGVESGGGQKVELFQSGPLDALKKAMPGTKFLGYESTTSPAKVVGIIAQNELCDALDEIGHEQPVVVVLDQSPFYGESGGQVGDRGQLIAGNMQFDVIDTQKDSGFTLHLGHLRSGTLRLGMSVEAQVTIPRRQGIRRAHSATHLLHFALQKHLGGHAQQQGSKVDEDWLRFDFTHPGAVTPEELASIEDEVNARIGRSDPIHWATMPMADARAAGAMMLFGEKYPDVVRMVSMGDYSKELCGGTHLDNTAQVGTLRIIGEESVSAGTRRIIALTGQRAATRAREHDQLLSSVANLLRVPAGDVPKKVQQLVEELRDLKRKAKSDPKGKLTIGGESDLDEILKHAPVVGGTKIVVELIDEGSEVDGTVLRQVIDLLRRKNQSVAALLGAQQAGQVLLLAGLTRDLVDKGLSASKWVADAAKQCGGKGGGKPDMAQGGGKDASQLPAAIATARQQMQTWLG